MTASDPAIAPHQLDELVGTGRATIPDVFVARASKSADRPFLSWGTQAWTYAEALAEAERFAGWALSVSPARDEPPKDCRIASFLPNMPEAVWTWLGTLLAGRVYVPVNRSHRGPILRGMLERSRADVLVIDAEGLDLLPDLDSTSIHTILVVDGSGPHTVPNRRVATWTEVDGAGRVLGQRGEASDLAEVIYTSGTTGRSKAVLIPHGQMVRGAAWIAWSLGLTEADVMHGWLPLFHIGGQVDMFLAFVVSGGSIALQPTFSRSGFWKQVEEAGATVFIGFSNVLEILWAMDPRPGEQGCTLRAGIVGGIPPALHRPFEERFGLRLCDIYGMTEANPLALPAPGVSPPAGAAGPASPDFELAILDEVGERTPTGEVGQLAFRPRVPDVMLRSYEGDEFHFVEVTRNMWFRTGDLGRLDTDGNFYFVDRKKHAIRRRGENISSFELERIVLDHDAVEEVCALGIPSPLGEDDVKLVVAARPGRVLEPAALRAWCVDRMAAFMVPRYIDLRDQLPRNPAGKVQKEDLRANPAHVYDAEAATMGAPSPGRDH